MKSISLEKRRAILREKLQGASNRAAAERVGVSKGTVANVIDEARAGNFPAIDNLETQLDAMMELSKRLDEEDLSVSAAHTGLDVLTRLEDLELDPAALATFNRRLTDLALGDPSIETYANAAVRLQTLEEMTGLSVEGQLPNLLDFLAGNDSDELDTLTSIVDAARKLDGGVDQVGTAIERAVRLSDQGFDTEVATMLADALADIEEDSTERAIDRLSALYSEYESLTAGVDTLQTKRGGLESEVETLQQEISDLETDREQLRTSIDRLDHSLETSEQALNEHQDILESLEVDIQHRRSRLETLEGEYQAIQEELQSIQAERDVVHAYRRFLRDQEISDVLLSDVAWLLDIREGKALDELESQAPTIEEQLEQNLLQIAREMIEGEEMVPKPEHERKLRKKAKTERTLEELQEELETARTLRDFLEFDEISEDLLEELLRMKRGRASLTDRTEARKTEEVRSFLNEQLTSKTEGREVIDKSRHHRELHECREEYARELLDAYEAIERLSHHIESLQTQIDDQEITEVAEKVQDSLEATGEASSVEALSPLIQEVFADEIDRRVDQECEKRVAKALQKGIELGSREGVGFVSAPSPESSE